MRSHSLAFLLTLLLFTGFISGANVWAQTPAKSPLQAMDDIVSPYPTLDKFLADQPAVERYYQAVEDYFGPDKMSRVKFDAILTQMKITSEKVPGFSERMWQTTNLGKSFSVRSEVPSYGRDLSNSWNGTGFIREHLAPQGSTITDIKQLPPHDRERVLSGMIDDIKSIENSLDVEGLPKAQRKALEGQHYARLRQSPEVKKLASFYTSEILSNARVVDLMNSNEPDLILDTIKGMRDNPRAFLPPTLELPGPVITEIKSLLPDSRLLLADKTLFPEITYNTKNGMVPVGGSAVTEFSFNPVPRRLHGIWKGIPLQECVGGGCASADGVNKWSKLTPERWATVAIENSQLHFLEKNGKYSGFVEAVPGMVGNKPHITVGLGAPDLKKRIVILDSNGAKQTTYLFEEWYKAFDKIKPAGWGEIIISGKDAINNARVLGPLRGSPAYQYGRKLPASSEFRLTDPLIPGIAQTSEEISKNFMGYSNKQMILDATVNGASESGYTALTTKKVSLTTHRSNMAKKLLGNDEQEVRNILKALESDGFMSRQLQSQIYTLVKREPDHAELKTAVSALVNSGMDITDGKVLEKMLANINRHSDKTQLILNLQYPGNKDIHRVLQNFKVMSSQHGVSGRIEVFEAILRLDPTLKDPGNHAWYTKILDEAVEKGHLKTIEVYAKYPRLNELTRGRYPFLLAENASQVVRWIEQNPKKVLPITLEALLKLEPTPEQRLKILTLIKDHLLAEPVSLSSVMEKLAAFEVTDLELRPFNEFLTARLSPTHPESKLVIDYLHSNRWKAKGILPEIRRLILQGSHPEIRRLATIHLSVNTDALDTKLIQKVLSLPEPPTAMLLANLKAPASPEVLALIRSLEIPAEKSDFYRNKYRTLYRMDPELQDAPNREWFRSKMAKMLQTGNLDAIGDIVSGSTNKTASALLAEEIIRQKRYDAIFDLGLTYSNNQRVHEAYLNKVRDPELSKIIIKHLNDENYSNRMRAKGMVMRLPDHIQQHPDLWRPVLSKLSEEQADLKASINEALKTSAPSAKKCLAPGLENLLQ